MLWREGHCSKKSVPRKGQSAGGILPERGHTVGTANLQHEKRNKVLTFAKSVVTLTSLLLLFLIISRGLLSVEHCIPCLFGELWTHSPWALLCWLPSRVKVESVLTRRWWTARIQRNQPGSCLTPEAPVLEGKTTHKQQPTEANTMDTELSRITAPIFRHSGSLFSTHP